MTIQIPITHGLFAIVDDDVGPEITGLRWRAQLRPHNLVYVIRSHQRPDGNGFGTIRLHRVIMNAPSDMEVDHVDGDGLNNQRSNLRLCTRAQNCANMKRRVGVKTPYRGVFNPANNRWCAVIRTNGKKRHLGYFDTPEEARDAYIDAAKRFHGEFARFE